MSLRREREESLGTTVWPILLPASAAIDCDDAVMLQGDVTSQKVRMFQTSDEPRGGCDGRREMQRDADAN